MKRIHFFGTGIGFTYTRVAFMVGALLLLFSADLRAFTSPVETKDLPNFPETVFVRRSYFEQITGPVEESSRLELDVLEEPGEEADRMVQFRVEENTEELLFFFTHISSLENRQASEDEEAAGAGEYGGSNAAELEETGTVPTTASKGDYVAVRNKEEGNFTSLTIYLKSGEETFLRIRSMGENYSSMNIYLLGRRVQRDVRIPYTIEELMRHSFSTLMESTAAYVDWDFYLPDSILFMLGTVKKLAASIRVHLPELEDAEDGAINRNGEYVYIKDGSLQKESAGLNCSGFAKWVVDGIYILRKNSYLPISELKRKHPQERGNRWSRKYEDIKDPYFGLDWTRNLAVSMRRLSEPEAKIESADVNDLSYHEYEEDVGYSVEVLKTLLYELAVKEPEYFYLGSVNELAHGEGELRVHSHVAVFLPWLDREGRLRVSIMERGNETPIDRFIDANEQKFIHLVRVKTKGVFRPPALDYDPLLNR